MSTGRDTSVPATVIRPMVESDISAALRLWKKTAGVEISEGDSPAELAKYLVRNPGGSHVALLGTELIGAILAGDDGRRGFIYHLAVTTRYRDAGIGGVLVSRSLAVLKSLKIKRVLILVAADNPRGRRFWEQNGWEPMDFAQVMGKNL